MLIAFSHPTAADATKRVEAMPCGRSIAAATVRGNAHALVRRRMR
jgi:hypothetical protein